jgi:hypothetical protein
VPSQRPPKKGGPQSEFAWLVDEGVRACQRQRRLPSLEIVQSELATEIAIGLRTLQSWRANRFPDRYEDLRNFARACLQAAPDLGQAWVINLFRTAGMPRDIELALSDLQLQPREPALAEAPPNRDQLLSARIIRPDPIFQRVQLADFVGREWLTTKVDAFLADPLRQSGVFVLTGEVGVGKTTFLAQLVQQRNYIQLFGEQVPGTPNLSRALRSLAAQLITRYPWLSPELDPALMGSWPDDPLAFEQLLRSAARGLLPDEHLIIVCDALNDVGTVPGGNVLGLPAVLPDGVYLIVSHSLVPIRLNFILAPQVEWLDPKSADNLRDMDTYLHRIAHSAEVARWLQVHHQSVDEFTRTLLEHSGGNWLYLSHVVSEIRRGSRAKRELYMVPASLANHYARHVAHWRDKDQTRWDTLYAPVLVTLVAAREPISLDRLIAWSGVTALRQEVRRLLREDWRPFIREHYDPTQGTLYTLYHHSASDFVLGKVDRSGLSVTTLFLLDDLQAHLRAAHRRIVEYFRRQCDGDWSRLAGQAYADRHLSYHLEQVQGQGTTPLILLANCQHR